MEIAQNQIMHMEIMQNQSQVESKFINIFKKT